MIRNTIFKVYLLTMSVLDIHDIRVLIINKLLQKDQINLTSINKAIYTNYKLYIAFSKDCTNLYPCRFILYPKKYICYNLGELKYPEILMSKIIFEDNTFIHYDPNKIYKIGNCTIYSSLLGNINLLRNLEVDNLNLICNKSNCNVSSNRKFDNVIIKNTHNIHFMKLIAKNIKLENCSDIIFDNECNIVNSEIIIEHSKNIKFYYLKSLDLLKLYACKNIYFLEIENINYLNISHSISIEIKLIKENHISTLFFNDNSDVFFINRVTIDVANVNTVNSLKSLLFDSDVKKCVYDIFDISEASPIFDFVCNKIIIPEGICHENLCELLDKYSKNITEFTIFDMNLYYNKKIKLNCINDLVIYDRTYNTSSLIIKDSRLNNIKIIPTFTKGVYSIFLDNCNIKNINIQENTSGSISFKNTIIESISIPSTWTIIDMKNNQVNKINLLCNNMKYLNLIKCKELFLTNYFKTLNIFPEYIKLPISNDIINILDYDLELKDGLIIYKKKAEFSLFSYKFIKLKD